ncbi:HEAT repeat domain-containing protein [Archangium gephyra]|nr:HEAT repeat domain-containing protein [Archangium gephyra]
MKLVPDVKQVLRQRVESVREEGVAVRVLVERMMRGPSDDERTSVIRKLLQVVAKDLSPDIRAAMPEEGWALLDSSPEAEVRYIVVRMLGVPDSPSALAWLRRGLADPDREVRWACVQALRAAPLATDMLLSHLCSERWEERDSALKLVSPPLSAPLRDALCRLLADPEPMVRYRTAELLRGEGEVPGLRAVLLEAMRGQDGFHQRCLAISHLHELGMRPDALPVLYEVLRADPSPYPREEAIQALGDLVPTIPEAAERLLEALTDANETVRNTAASVLPERGELTGPLGTKLLRAAEDPRIPMSTRVCLALGLAERKLRPVIPALLHMLQTAETYEKLTVLEALELLGSLPAEAEPVLRSLAAAGDEMQRLLAAKALMSMGAEPALLQTLLRDLLPETSGDWERLKETLLRAKRPEFVFD